VYVPARPLRGALICVPGGRSRDDESLARRDPNVLRLERQLADKLDGILAHVQ
jgi:hypothetical protein